MEFESDLNFLPDDYVAARARARANRLCGTLLAVVIIGVAGAFGYAEASLQQLRAEHVRVTGEFDREAARIGQLDALQKQQQAVARRATLAEALVEKTSRTALLADVKSRLPDSTSLTEVVLKSRIREIKRTPEQVLADRQAARAPGGVKVAAEPQPKRYDVAMKLMGMAYTDKDVSDFMGGLQQSRYFDDVNLIGTDEVSFDGQFVRKFEIEAIVRETPRDAAAADVPVVSTRALLTR